MVATSSTILCPAMRLPAKPIIAGLLFVLAVAALFEARVVLRSVSLVTHAAQLDGWAQWATAWPLLPVTIDERTIQTRHGSLRVRLYVPEGGTDRSAILTPGIHAGGADEVRLVDLAHNLAAHGFGIVSLDLPDLRAYEITSRTTDMIEDATLWAVSQAALAPDRKIGLIGISFGGGLSVVAAGRSALAEHIAFVFSFGGHGDFPRVLRYLCSGRLPDGRVVPPHDYGVVIALYGAAHRVVPPEQVESLQHAIRVFLNASHLDMVDKPRASKEFQRARDIAAELPEPAARLMRAVNARDVETIGPLLLPLLGSYGDAAALSPERSPPPTSPVYLLHGTDDNVIPAVESTLLARHLDAHTRVRHLVSPLITHAEVDRAASVLDAWRVIALWSDLLKE